MQELFEKSRPYDWSFALYYWSAGDQPQQLRAPQFLSSQSNGAYLFAKLGELKFGLFR